MKMLNKRKNINETLQRNRIVALEFLNRLATYSGDKRNNIIYINYDYNDYSFGVMQYRTNISGNIEIYSEIGQLIFAGNNIFSIYDFIISLSPSNIQVMTAIIEALRFDHSITKK